MVLSKRKEMIEEQSELVKRFKSNRQLLSNLKLAQEYFANLIEREKRAFCSLISDYIKREASSFMISLVPP